MTDREIKSLLASVETPPPAAATQRRWAERAWSERHHHPHGQTNPRPINYWQAVSWALGGGLLASLAFIFSLSRRPSFVLPYSHADDDRTLVREVSAVFPGQLNAIIEHRRSQEVQLTDTAGAFMTQPIVIELVRGQDRLRILTFSGQSVSLDLGDQTVRLDFLVGEHNQVFVLGQDSVLFPRSKPMLKGYQLSARLIHASL